MTTPRKSLVSLADTPYYHCVSRCVRRAFLCGCDPYTGQSYQHRRQWIQDRIGQLAQSFAIDVGAYAVMSNHTHLVLHVNAAKAKAWSDREVIERWLALYTGTDQAQRKLRGEALLEAEEILLAQKVSEWRERLHNLSWFMRSLNEPIARRANQEDGCSGRFWEGRFKTQALLDEAALLSCLAYVDLNPIRAGIATTPETSEHTSIQQRIQETTGKRKTKETIGTASSTPPDARPSPVAEVPKPIHLFPFAGTSRPGGPEGLPFPETDYLALVDWTGRILREDKQGHIPASTLPILERLHIESEHWLILSRHFESRFKGLIGSIERVKEVCDSLGKCWSHGMRACRELLPT